MTGQDSSCVPQRVDRGFASQTHRDQSITDIGNLAEFALEPLPAERISSPAQSGPKSRHDWLHPLQDRKRMKERTRPGLRGLKGNHEGRLRDIRYQTSDLTYLLESDI